MTPPRASRRAAGLRAAALGVAALAAAGAAAQTPRAPTRSGFWLEAGAGTGGVWVGCEGCTDVTASFGENGYLRGGGAFSDRVLWGVEVFGLPTVGGPATSDSTFRVNNVSVGPVVLWYPWRGGVFVKGGVGLSRSEVRLPGPGGGGAILGQATGTGLSFGVGLDVPLFRRWALTASLGSHVGAVGDLTVQDASVDDVITTMYHASVALTLR